MYEPLEVISPFPSSPQWPRGMRPSDRETSPRRCPGRKTLPLVGGREREEEGVREREGGGRKGGRKGEGRKEGVGIEGRESRREEGGKRQRERGKMGRMKEGGRGGKERGRVEGDGK